MSDPTPTRRDALRAALLAASAAVLPSAAAAQRRRPVETPHDPVPTPQQLAWQRAELTMFAHFGVNTFTDREWGEGTESPSIFNPSALDADQWVSTARDAGFRYLILTAKHHDGFCLWPSRHTTHSVAASPWRGGKGDVVREVADACRRHKVNLGVYLSPWDRHERTYGDSPAYNRYFCSQLDELLTLYGPVAEVWFDGACGEGPNGKRQEYDWQAFYEVVRKRQPRAVIAISGPDIRWVGNEDGFARETEWSVQPAERTFHAGRTGNVWWPAECDVSIRPGWFWHAGEDARVKSLEHLTDIYFRSVGRNANLLLNVPPNQAGLFADPDVARLREFRARIDTLFRTDLARGRPVQAAESAPGARSGHATDGREDTWWAPGGDDGSIEIALSRPARIGMVRLQEHIPLGQRVEAYAVEALTDAGWVEACEGTTIGHKKLDRFAPVTAARVRVTVRKARARPLLQSVGVYAPA